MMELDVFIKKNVAKYIEDLNQKALQRRLRGSIRNKSFTNPHLTPLTTQ
jgi:hypothetical protein